MQQQRALELPLALRETRNWVQLLRFALVGTSGYFVNLAIFGVLVHAGAVDYRVAAGLSYAIAVANNFAWNRMWTFSACEGHAGFQAARFVCVSVAAFAVNLGFLTALVDASLLPKLPAQAISIMAATPLSFLGNKLWTFR